MKRRRWAMGLAGLLLLAVSTWQIAAASRGLEITTIRSAVPPLTIVNPEGAAPGSRPLVLVGHGFAGSTVLMRGFALALAHAGYTVALWDFDGHGANPNRMPSDMHSDALLANAEAAQAAALAGGYGQAGRVAILGHSMGSAVALVFGQEHPNTAATIAVSPAGRTVQPDLPQNLLLMAGSLEAPFAGNAEQLLAEAGGPGGDPAAGTARKLVVIPGVEHISILFSPTAHAVAREWLDATFGPQPGARPYTDRRMLWYGLGVLSLLLVAAALAPTVRSTRVGASSTGSESADLPAGAGSTPARAGSPDPAQVADLAIRQERKKPTDPLLRRLAVLAGGALGATLLLWLASRAGLGLAGLLGLLVGGYLLVWYGVAGLLCLLLLRRRPSPPARRELLAGLIAFGALWLGLGLLGQWVWLPWLLIAQRLVLWPLGALLLLPWFLAVGEMAQGSGLAGQIGWWLAQSATLAGALWLALSLSPELYFLALILPLFPVIVGLHALAAAPQRTSWAFALSGALFTSWLLLAVFPLQ